jgi:hypothetical protein
VIAAPPFDAGALRVTVAAPVVVVAEIEVGAPGVVAGVTVGDAALGRLSPTPVVAMTVTV